MTEIVLYDVKYRDDVSKLVAEFYEQALDDAGLVHNEDTVSNFEASCGESTFILLEEGVPIGVLAGSVSASEQFQCLIYQEVVWYTYEKHRGQGLRLLKHLEEWCKKEGIKKIVMTFMHNSMPDRLYEFYKRQGYQPLETHLIKDVI